MLKYLVLLICMQLVKAQYLAQASQKYEFIIPKLTYMNRHYFARDNKPIIKNYDFDKSGSEEDFSNRDDQFTSSIYDDINQVIVDLKMKMNEEFKQLTTLDKQNQEKAKKTIQESHQELLNTLETIRETKREIQNRVEYVEQLLYKKRDERDVDASIMNCVIDNLSKLGRITPELMKDEEKCISAELDMSRSVARVALDMLKDNLHKIKQQQERLNRCNTISQRKQCLIDVYISLVHLKKNIRNSSKIPETVVFLNGLSDRMHTCSMAQISKVVSRAGEVILNFNTCLKGNGVDSKKQKSELLMFLV